MNLEDFEATKASQTHQVRSSIFPIQGDKMGTSIKVTHTTMIQDEDGVLRSHTITMYGPPDVDPDFHLGYVGAE
jgi:hypothetical protein